MIRRKKLIAIIPVRKNSLGIKNKNLITLKNKSLLERTIILSKKNKFIDQTIVTTNCSKMFEISKKYNCNSKKLRPNYLSGKYALTIDAIKHEIKINKLDDVFILLLQVTSPFRSQLLTNKFLNKFNKFRKYLSSVSVTKFDHPHPHKVQLIKNDKLISMLKKESMVPRQKLPAVYAPNGLFYITHCNNILKNNSFFSKSTLPFLVKKPFSLNLDSNLDLYLMKALEEYAED